MLKFTDGININTDGELRSIHLRDGWYVVGNGMLIPCDDEQEADDIIRQLSAGASQR